MFNLETKDLHYVLEIRKWLEYLSGEATAV